MISARGQDSRLLISKDVESMNPCLSTSSGTKIDPLLRAPNENHLALLSICSSSHQGLDISVLKLLWTVCEPKQGFPFSKMALTVHEGLKEQRAPDLDGLLITKRTKSQNGQ